MNKLLTAVHTLVKDSVGDTWETIVINSVLASGHGRRYGVAIRTFTLQDDGKYNERETWVSSKTELAKLRKHIAYWHG